MNMNFKHLLYWLIYGLLLYVFFDFFVGINDSLEHSIVFVVFQFLSFYVNYKILIPLFYSFKKFTSFSLFNLVLLIVGAVSHTAIEDGLPKEEYYAFESLMAHSVPIFIGIFIAFVLFNYNEQLRLEKKEKERILAEKSFLIQQINPHFLFNALNNIYSLTIDNNPKGSDAILQLSKMLDYSLYGNKNEHVPLEKEILYIKNFIALFKLKDEELKNIVFEFNNLYKNNLIAPMLFLPFIENAFKHGDVDNLEDGFLHIKINSKQDEIDFLCINSYSKNKNVDRVGGIGIKNVSRRLELLYPKKHNLSITKNDDIYKVELKITLDEV